MTDRNERTSSCTEVDENEAGGKAGEVTGGETVLRMELVLP